MSALIEEATENFYHHRKHLYILEVTGTKAWTGKGSRTYKAVQVTATCRSHAIDKARELKGLKVIGAITPLGQVKKSLEERYFRRYGKQLQEQYNIDQLNIS